MVKQERPKTSHPPADQKPQSKQYERPMKKRIEKARMHQKPGKGLLELLKLKPENSQADTTDQPKIFTQYKYSQLKTLNPYIKKSLEKLNYVQLTKIQVKSYLPISKRDDCVLKSETGSGKTMAYWVPILNSLMNEEIRVHRRDGIRVLVIVPTRELAIQIQKIVEKISRCAINIVSGLLIGGNSIESEKTAIRKGLNVVIATPARLVYHLHYTARFSLANLTTVVFEECDRTLDMGFKKDVFAILENIYPRIEKVHKIFVSACLSESVESLLHEISQKKEEKIENVYKFIGFNVDLKVQTSPETLNHFYLIVEERKKVTAFLSFLKLSEKEKIIVFVSTADQANFLERVCVLFDKPVFGEDINKLYENKVPTVKPIIEDFKELQKLDLSNLGGEVDPAMAREILKRRETEKLKKDLPEEEPVIIKPDLSKKFLQTTVYKIHGYMTQKDRTEVFHNFYTCTKGVLICTDVGSRGLDFTGTRVIVLFDVSPSYKDYINRVGRTARIGNEGSAISFLYEKESKYAAKLTENCKAQEILMEDLEQSFRDQEKPESRNFGQFLDFQIRKTVEMYQLSNLARRAFVSFCRAYSRLKDNECFNLKRLNLGGISKSYGCRSVKGDNETGKIGYATVPDSKQLNSQEVAHLERKRAATIQGIRDLKSRKFEKNEFE